MAQSIDTMTVRDAIYGRCSVRAYTPEQIDRPTLLTLLAAAVRAPTAMHGEPWQFVIVQDIDRLKRLSDRAKVLFSAETKGLHPDRGNRDIFSQPGFNVFHDAGTLVVICAKTAGPFAQADCWLAAQNLMLAAHAMGLGTCVIGSAASALNEPDVKHELGIPPGTIAIAPIVVGKPRGEVLPSPRNEPQVLAWR
jgi:nitroreductase